MKIRNINHLYLREWRLAAVVLLLSFLLVYTSRTLRLESGAAIAPPERSVLLIHDTVGLDELIGLMEENGIGFQTDELRWASGILGWRRFNQGRYELDGPMSYSDFFSKLALGLQDPMPLRIPPGLTKERLRERISMQMQFDARELAEVMRDTSFLGSHDLEPHLVYGRILPDTYEVYWTASPQRLLERLFSEFETRVIRPHADKLQQLGRSVDEITTLASIIEWEARFEDEKRAISGVYWNRLNRRWRLQADPTVNYAKGERSRLVYDDYRIDHPYNTYRVHGLPPGPITNPTLSSIEAALYPEDHNYMYMVATPDGRHAFSRTYAEHRRKSRQWTDWLRDQRRIKAEMEREEMEREKAEREKLERNEPLQEEHGGSNEKP
ncbi:MAG: endolytic transglycosylase MltG [Bacteroidota bacterium]